MGVVGQTLYSRSYLEIGASLEIDFAFIPKITKLEWSLNLSVKELSHYQAEKKEKKEKKRQLV